ncbi:MAG TPA: hypothetical protein VNI20_09530 [Fimbriimonadaceae bacterium]|nr:hypothetical protein [Fimbriimonadaceae bacterium]
MESWTGVPLSRQLIGTDEATIDEKGRLLLSKKKRERLGDPFLMALGSTGCVIAYPLPVWEQMVAEIMQNPSTNQARQHYTRLIIGTAEDDLKCDRQGRVVVPQKLRDAARLVDKVVVVGCLDRLEIWAKAEWEKYESDPDGYGRERREAVDRAYRQMTGKD